MYGKGKGMADSALPFKRTPASWVKITSADVVTEGEFTRNDGALFGEDGGLGES